jgi:hypothetical protein
MLHTMIRTGTLSGTILGTWIILAVSLTGVGCLLARFASRDRIRSDDLFLAFWIGYAAVLGALQLWHLVLPVSALCALLLITVGGAGILRCRSQITNWIRTIPIQRHLVVLLAAASIVVWLAYQATGERINWDSATYHVPVMEWSKAYPIAPGLGNLSSRFAYYSSHFLYAAMLDVGPWAHRSQHLANGLLLVVYAGQVLLAASRLASSRGALRCAMFDLLLLAPVLLLSLAGQITSFTTDLPVALLAFVGTSALLRGFTEPGASTFTHLSAAIALLVTAASVKLGAAPYAAIALALVVFAIVRQARGNSRLALGRIGFVILLAGAIGVPAAVRSTILSGYPFYPSTFGRMDVDWKVPVEQAEGEAAWITHTSRTFFVGHTEDYSQSRGASWIRPWLAHFGRRATIGRQVHALWEMAIPGAVALLAFVAMSVGARRPQAGWRGDLLMYVLPLAALTVWFVTVANPRFGFMYWWILAALAGAHWFDRTVHTGDARGRRRALGLALLVGLSPFGAGVVLGSFSGRTTVRQEIRQLLVVRDAPIEWWFAPTPVPDVTTFTTDTGLDLVVPTRDYRCFRAPLPCTSQPASNLALRRPPDISSGFRTDGRWLQQNWPNPYTNFKTSWLEWSEVEPPPP